MSLLILIPLSISMGMLGVAAFIWALHHNQFDDPKGNACRVLLNEDPPQTKRQTHDNLASNPENENT